MIDIHSHLINEVDDGAKNIEETSQMLKEAIKAGFTDVILTPHYMENYYTTPCDKINEKIKEIKEMIPEGDIQLYQGNEIYCTSNIIDLLNSNKATALNNSRYVLFELQMQEKPINLDEVIYLLINNNKIPVIAHPERYKYVQEDPNILLDYISRGVLFQANYPSIIGKYGKKIQQTVKQLLTHNMIHFLASDCHIPNTIYPNMEKVLKILNKWLDEKQVQKLTVDNPKCILKDEKFDIDEPEKIQKRFFKF